MFANIEGTKIYFDVEGSGYVPQGPTMVKKPVLFAIHGGPGSDHSDLKPWLTSLTDLYQIVYFDQRCNGQSDRVDPATCTFDQLAKDIESLKEYLGLEKISVLGHSFGGMVAQVYASQYAESIDKLFLICTAPSRAFYDDALEFAKRIATPEQYEMIPALFEGNITDEQHLIEWWDKNWGLYWYKHDEKLMFETGNRPIGCQEIANYTFKYFMPNYDVRHALSKFNMPTLIVAGRHDWITPVTQAKVMHELIPNAELAIFEESGHMPFIEEQEKFIQVMRQFITK